MIVPRGQSRKRFQVVPWEYLRNVSAREVIAAGLPKTASKRAISITPPLDKPQ